MSYMSKAEMNVLELKNGDIVTLTALYEGDGGGNPLKKHIMDDDDTKIYAELTSVGKGPVVFIQYKGNKQYQFSSCDLISNEGISIRREIGYRMKSWPDSIPMILEPSYTIKDIKIENQNYPLLQGWATSRGLYLVQPFNNNLSFINWLNENPLEVKQ